MRLFSPAGAEAPAGAGGGPFRSAPAAVETDISSATSSKIGGKRSGKNGKRMVCLLLHAEGTDNIELVVKFGVFRINSKHPCGLAGVGVPSSAIEAA